MSEQIMMSDDPKDPRWRFRVLEEDGLTRIFEEELSSASPTAQPTGVTNCLLLTQDQAEWMAKALANVVRSMGRFLPEPLMLPQEPLPRLPPDL